VKLRIAVILLVAAVAAVAVLHPIRQPAIQSSVSFSAAAPSPLPSDDRPRRRGGRPIGGDDALVVYVAGAVKKPGLYGLRPGDRAARAVALAGGFVAGADTAAVNLAQRAQDGDEVYVPREGESRHASASPRRGSRHGAHRRPPGGDIDVNRAAAAELASVPGIGRAIAQRIVEVRERDGSFATLDELLDVAGMTQSRLERARPYLREP
jgi:competence protein ComEA